MLNDGGESTTNSRNEEGKRRNILSEKNTEGPNNKQFKTTPTERRCWISPGRTGKWGMNMWSGKTSVED